MDLRAVIFVPALVGAIICGFVFLMFASHYYLTVLESTATGAKDVTWLSEPITDNFWKPFYLAWLLLLQSATVGSFVSLDVLLFFLFFELSLVPAYFLIAGWSDPARGPAAAMKRETRAEP